jgi:hypothetical protein
LVLKKKVGGMKKKNYDSGSAVIIIVSIIVILLIVLIVKLSLGKACNSPRPNIAVSIDRDGNVYDGENHYVGKLADPNIRFYDDNGNLLGQATFDVIKIN